MAYPQQTKEQVRRDFVSGRQTLETAAQLAKVPFQTARDWKRRAKEHGDDWDKARAAYILADGGAEDLARVLLAELIVQFRDTMEKVQSDESINTHDRVKLIASLSDSFSKTIATNRKLMPKTSEFEMACNLLKVQLDWTKKHFPQHTPVILELFEPFGKWLEAEYLNET